MRLHGLVFSFVAVAACASFGEDRAPADAGSLDVSADSGASDGPPAPDPDAGAGDACGPACVLFADDFERDSSDVQGLWSSKQGTLKLAGTGTSRGTVLQGGASAGGAGAGFRGEYLAKELPPQAAGIVLEAYVRAATEPDAGTFGTDAATDYCEILTVMLGADRIAMLYLAKAGLHAWLYGPDELDGVGRSFSADPSEWSRYKLALAWTSSEVTLVAGREGTDKSPLTRTLAPGRAAAVPTVRAGARCSGQTPPMVALVDGVVVRTNP